MAELPSGTVTCLFTDIEGSTRLIEQLGKDRYAALLAEHHELLRAAFAAHNGHEIDTQGDAFFIAFARATDAIAAVIAAQRALAAHAWPEGPSIRVRMGLHTGEPALTATGYVGLDIHRAARICSAGHGGQVLISQTTRALLGSGLPLGVSLKDLGPHRLKDLASPEQIFQLVIPDLPTDFPPLKSLDALPNNLPVQLTSFIGREPEMAAVKKLLKTTRLLTLTGMGGCGKTRLAIQLAADLLEEYPDGVWLVELAALVDSSLVPQAVASVLSVREAASRPLLPALCDALQAKQLLLMLDNCEHLIEACAQLVETLLRSCVKLRILATSRELLSVAGESAWRVPPLSLPDPQCRPTAENLEHYEAIRLFTERARAVSSAFAVTDQIAPALIQICRRLDGIPLAIELAAARVKVLSVEQIAARLDDRFKLLTGGSRTAVRRQQTLQAAIDWSYSLLSDKERTLLRRISIFAGGCTIEGAEAVCAGEGFERHEVLDLLSQLVDKSLVLKGEARGEARYRLLETIRQYGQEKLMEAGEAATLRTRHLNFFLRLAEQAQSGLETVSQDLWLGRLELENDNLRAALEWSQSDGGTAEAGMRMAGALWRFWWVRGYFSEGRRWLEGALKESANVPMPLRMQALHGAGALALYQGDFARAKPLLEESLTLSRQHDDKPGLARALNSLGTLAWHQGNYAEARGHFEVSLAIRRELGDQRAIGISLNNLGTLASDQGDYASARALFEESLAIKQQMGDKRGLAGTLNNLGALADVQGDFAAARSFFEESLRIRRELGDKPDIAQALNNLGDFLAALGDHRTARPLLEEGLAIDRELGDRRSMGYVLDSLGNVAHLEGNAEEARRFFEESLAIKRELGEKPSMAATLTRLGSLIRSKGDFASSQALLAESLSIRRALADRPGIAHSLEGFAGLALAQGQLARAVQLLAAAEALREAIHVPLAPAERTEQEDELATARAGLEEKVFADAWTAGRAMSLEQAVSYALAEDRTA